MKLEDSALDFMEPIMEVEDEDGDVINIKERCTGHYPNKNHKTIRPSEIEWRALYKKYPDLKPDPEYRLCLKNEVQGIGCKERALKNDKFCLLHTKRDLAEYEIPFMCNRKKKNNRRCTQLRLEDNTICSLHFVRDRDTERSISMLTKMSKAKRVKRIKSEKALRSNKPEDWINLLQWKYTNPRDIQRLCEELVNRLRYNGIPLSAADSILDVAKFMLDAEGRILDLKKQKAEVIAEEDRKITQQIKEVKNTVFSLKDKLKSNECQSSNVEI